MSPKYARVEWERRFLLRELPPGEITRVVEISDRYLRGTRIRLRTMRSVAAAGASSVEYKLTQKIPSPSGGPGKITTIYLTASEHACFAGLPADVIEKTRYSIPPFGIDVFEAPVRGLVMAEAEFDSADEMQRLEMPACAIAEVTNDVRFAGGTIATGAPGAMEEVLRDFGLRLAVT